MDEKKKAPPTDNRCVCCGAEIPEGQMVCWRCRNAAVDYGPIDQRGGKHGKDEV